MENFKFLVTYTHSYLSTLESCFATKKGGDGNPCPSYLSLVRKVKVSRPWGTSCWVKTPAPSSKMVRASSLDFTYEYHISVSDLVYSMKFCQVPRILVWRPFSTLGFIGSVDFFGSPIWFSILVTSSDR